MNYLGHTIACSGYRAEARKNLEERIRADMKVYGNLPLNPFERAQIASDVLLPR